MKKATKKHKILMEMIYGLSMLVNLLGYHLSGFARRRKNRLVFGAWGGNKYSDNPRFLFEKLRKMDSKNLELIWVGKDHLRDLDIFQGPNPKVTFVKRNSLKSYYCQLTADKAFFANSYRDFGLLNLLKGATKVQLWHGFGLKNTLSAKRDVSPMKKRYYRVGAKSFEEYDYFISSSPANTQKILESFQGNGITPEKVIPSGQPKNEFLIESGHTGEKSNQAKENLREELLLKYGIPKDKLLFTYLPTFRDHRDTLKLSGLIGSEAEGLDEALKEAGAVLLEKFHLADNIAHELSKNESIYRVDAKEDSTDLLLITDVLITDYSSCYVDFSLLDRPVIHFLYDLEDYKTLDRGLYYPIEKYKAGPMVKELNELFAFISLAGNRKGTLPSEPEFMPEAREKVRKELMTYEKGKSTEEILAVVNGFQREGRK